MGDDYGVSIILIVSIMIILCLSLIDTNNITVQEVQILKSQEICKNSGIYNIKIYKIAKFDTNFNIACQNGTTEHFHGIVEVK
jgi:hypothetical protein